MRSKHTAFNGRNLLKTLIEQALSQLVAKHIVHLLSYSHEECPIGVCCQAWAREEMLVFESVILGMDFPFPFADNVLQVMSEDLGDPLTCDSLVAVQGMLEPFGGSQP